MAKKKFNVDILSKSSILQLQKDIQAYRGELNRKCEKIVDRLTDFGIATAKAHLGPYGPYVTFIQYLAPLTYGCTAIMLATNTGIIRSEWITKEGVKTADVSPLLMVEFGSGTKAENPMNIPGVGQGTFPGQTHAFESGWWYMDLNEQWHYTTGVTPGAPMYNAVVEMRKSIVSIAREVFR